jgi:signal peptidase I
LNTVPRGCRNCLRPEIELAVLVLVLGLLSRTWLAEGVLVPLLVPSGSMAPTLLGPHRDVVCSVCGHRYRVNSDHSPPVRAAACANCGHLQRDLDAQPAVAGDRLFLDKASFLCRAPRRWEVVAFRHPQRASMIFVKRVVGLPGERVQVRDGDVYVDGRIERKPLAVQRAMALLVYDAAWAGASRAARERWRAGPRSSWNVSGARLSTGASRELTWCEYHHFESVPGDRDYVLRESPVTDRCEYDPGWPRRLEDERRVGDLLLSLRVAKHDGTGRLVIRVSDGRTRFLGTLHFSPHRFEIHSADRAEALASGDLPAGLQEPLRVELSLIDQQVLLAVDGRTLAAVPYERQPGAPPPVSCPAAVGAQGLDVALDQVRLYRDIYYTRPVGMLGRWGVESPYALASGEYYVLGDNSPASDDSRSWPAGPAVPAYLLVGKPFAVHYPAWVLRWGGLQVQLPDPARIRYIR